MASVIGPAPMDVPPNGGYSPVAGQNSASTPRIGRPNSFVRSSQHGAVPQPKRTTTMTPGSYAQFDNRPIMYNQLGRPSSRPSSSSSNGSSVMTRDSVDTALRSPATYRTSFGSWDSQPRRPDYGWQRPAPIKQTRKRSQVGEQFAALPDEVLGLIMSSLRQLHTAADSFSCSTCMMRDLCSVALGSRRLLEVARNAL